MHSLAFVPVHFLQLEWQSTHRGDTINCPSPVHGEQIPVLEFFRLEEISDCVNEKIYVIMSIVAF